MEEVDGCWWPVAGCRDCVASGRVEHMVGRLFAIALGLISSALGQPVIFGIVSNASYAQAPNDSLANPIGHNIIAQGSIFAVFGSGMGPASLTYASLPLPTSLPDPNGTSITVTGGGKAVNAYLVYTSAGHLAALLPPPPPTAPPPATLTSHPTPPP